MLAFRRAACALALVLPSHVGAQWAQVTITSPSDGTSFASASAKVLFDACSTVNPTSVQVVAHGVGFSVSPESNLGACYDWQVRRRYSATVTLNSGPNTVRAEVCHNTQSPGCVSQTITINYDPGQPYAIALNRTTGPVTIRQDHSASYTFMLVNRGYLNATAWVGSQCTNIFSSCSQDPPTGSWVPINAGDSKPITITFTGAVVGSDYVWTNAYLAEDVNIGTGNNIGVTVTPKIYSVALNRTSGPVSIRQGQSGSYTFNVENTGDFAGTAILTSQCTNIFSSCSQSPGSGSGIYLQPGQSAPVTVSFTGSVVGSDYVWANAYYAENVNVGSGNNQSVSVTPRIYAMSLARTTGPVDMLIGGTASYTFTLMNTGDYAGNAIVGSQCTNIFSACSQSPSGGSSVYLTPGQSAPITVTFTGAVVGSDYVWTNAYYAEDVYTGTGNNQSVTVRQPVFSVGLGGRNPRATLDRGDCLTIAVAANAAYECGDLRVAHPLPTTITMNKARTPTLVYNSRFARATAWLAADVTYSGTPPAQIQATVDVAGLAPITKSFAWTPACDDQPCRIVVPIDAPNTPTGLYPATLQVKVINGSLTYATSDVMTDTVVIVNRSASPFGAGWWLDGLEQVISVSSTRKLWVGGDGSTRLYAQTSDPAVFTVSPMYDRPDTLKQVGSMWRRQLGDGAFVEFDNAGRHLRTVNALGVQTRFTYKSTMQGTPLDSIVLPTAGATRAYTFNYAQIGNGDPVLSAISAPAALYARTVSTARTNYAVTGITDIDGYTTSFSYDGAGRMSTRRDKVGDTTVFAYNDAGALKQVTRKMSRTEGSAAPSISTMFVPAETRSATVNGDPPMPVSTVTTMVDGPRQDVNDVTWFYVNRWGALDSVENVLGQRRRFLRESTTFPGLVTKTVSPTGFQTRAEYNQRGLVETVTAVDPYDQNCGNSSCNAVTRYHWHPLWNRVDTVTGPTGERTITQYQASLPLPSWIQTGNSTSRRTTFDYNASNQVSAVTEPGGSPSAIAYDALGNVMRTTSPGGIVSEVFRDAIGRDTLTLEPTDAAQTASLKKRNRTKYNAADRVDSVITIGAAVNYTLRTTGSRDPATITADTLATSYSYDAEGRRTGASILPSPDLTDVWVQEDWVYDAAGRVKIHGRNQYTERTTYDAAGNVLAYTSAAGAGYTQTFDALNRVTERRVDSRSYLRRTCEGFVAGPLTHPTDPGSCLTVFPAYPNSGSSYLVQADTARFTYDALGNILTADNRDAKVHRSYYRSGALKRDSSWVRDAQSSVFSHSSAVVLQYDLSGRRSALTLPDGRGISYAYQPDDGALSSILDPLGNAYQYRYDLAGRVDSLVIGGGGVREKRWYDADGRQYQRERYSPSVGWISSESLTFDAQGRVTVAKYYSGANGHYQDSTYLSYSGLGAVLARERRDWANHWEAEEFRVDAFGNVIRELSTGNDVSNAYPKTSTYTRRGALLSRDGVIPPSLQPYASDHMSTGVDADGHTTGSQTQVRNQYGAYTQDTPTRSYYAGDGTLGAVQRYGWVGNGNYSGIFEEYRYDALGRRVMVIEQHASRPPGCDLAGMSICASLCDFVGCVSKVTWTVWDGDQILQEERRRYPGDAGDTLQGLAQYVHGLELDKPLAALYPLTAPAARVQNPNWRGVFESSVTPAGATGDCSFSNGAPCDKIAWPGGQAVYSRPAPIDQGAGGGFTPYTFAGTLLTDQQDGSGQLYRRNRYYDPQSGRFTQEDPIGLAGGMNLYGFAGGDPINFKDPFGLCPVPASSCPPGYFTTRGATAGLVGGAVIASGCTVTTGICALGAPGIVAGMTALGTSVGAAGDAIAQNSDALALEMGKLGRRIRAILTGILIGKGGGVSDEQELMRRGGAKPAVEQTEEERRKQQEKKRGEGAPRGSDPPDQPEAK